MYNCIVCYNDNCKHHCGNSGCELAIITIGECGCLDFEEVDIYKEVEGFSRESKSNV